MDERLLVISENLKAIADLVIELADEDHNQFKVEEFWDQDIRGELSRSPGPYGSSTLNAQGGWWLRTHEQITGVCFHHTLSHSPHATARHYITKEGGRPSIPYHVWITEETGDILYCLDLHEGCWHNHNGNKNREISVGLAGKLHKYQPSDPQLESAAWFAAWAHFNPGMSVTLPNIKGHQDYAWTECPGWHTGWKDRLMDPIQDYVHYGQGGY